MILKLHKAISMLDAWSEDLGRTQQYSNQTTAENVIQILKEITAELTAVHMQHIDADSNAPQDPQE